MKKFTFPSNLQTLNLSGSSLDGSSGIDFPPDSKLKELILRHTITGEINDKIIRLPPFLERLDLARNKLKSLDKLLLPASLKFLDLSDNSFESLKIATPRSLVGHQGGIIRPLPFLEHLDLSENKLTSLDISLFPASLKFLDLSFNLFDSFNMPSNVESLDMSYNPLTSIVTASKNLELRALDLRRNYLSEFSFDMLHACKLAHLTLYLENHVADFSKVPLTLKVLKYNGPFSHPEYSKGHKDDDDLTEYQRREESES